MHERTSDVTLLMLSQVLRENVRGMINDEPTSS